MIKREKAFISQADAIQIEHITKLIHEYLFAYGTRNDSLVLSYGFDLSEIEIIANAYSLDFDKTVRILIETSEEINNPTLFSQDGRKTFIHNLITEFNE